MTSTTIIVMGVSGSGKSLIGEALAQQLGLPFFDADDFHGPDNIRKMASGTPLSDADRTVWLDDLAALLAREDGLVLACSALKKAYRERLRQAVPDVRFLYLKGDFDLIWSRLSVRENHYFSGRSMLRSQFEQLEEPALSEAQAIDINLPPEGVLKACVAACSHEPDPQD